MNYIISQYLVFEKNDQGGILPETRWNRKARLYNEGHAEEVSNWNKYQEDEKALTNLNKKLQENGQTITDNAERQKIADKVLKNASERAKDYGNQIVANTKTLSDFKKENEVEDPNKQVKPKFTDGLKSFASSALSSIGNAVISAGTAMIAQQLISWGLQIGDYFIHMDENRIAKGQEAYETIQNQTKAYEDQKASLGELTAKYTELSKGVKISGNSIKNISLTDDEYKDFLDTSNQIAAAAPSLTRSWDSQGNAILNAGTNAEDLNTQVNDYLKLQRNLTYYDMFVVNGAIRIDHFGTSKTLDKNKYNPNGKHTYKITPDTVYCDGTKIYTHTVSSNSAPNKLHIGAVCTNGTISKLSNVNIYSFKFYDGSNLILNLIPYKDNNKKYCFKDLVNNKLYYSGSPEELKGFDSNNIKTGDILNFNYSPR